MTYLCPRCGAGNNPDRALVCSCGEPIDRRDAPEAMIEFIGPQQSEPSIVGTTNRSGHGRTWIGAAAIMAMAVVALVSSRGEFDSLPVSEVAPNTDAAASAATPETLALPTTPPTAAVPTDSTVVTPSVSIQGAAEPPLPVAVAEVLGGAIVIDHDDFLVDSGRWDLAGYASRWAALPDRITVGTRTERAGGGIRSNFALVPGTAAVLRVTFSVRTAAQFLLDAGAVGDSGYRRYGIRMGEGWEVDGVTTAHYEGAVEITGNARVGDVEPVAGGEYYVMLGVDGDGTLAFGVWPVAAEGSAVEIRNWGETWSGRSWRLHAGVTFGILNVFEFWLVSFSGLG